MEQLLTISNIQEWKSTVSVEIKETIPGSWSEKVELSKAMRCYAAENNKRLVDVSESEVKESELGVQGYAALFAKTPAAQPKAGGDGSNAGGNKGGKKKRGLEEEPRIDVPPPVENPPNPNPNPNKRPKGGNSSVAGKKEKEVKELLAQEQASDNTMSMITIEMKKSDADAWAWAPGFVKSYKDCRVQVLQLYADNPFFQSMKVAVLSPKELAKVKKDYKDQYLSKLCDFVSVLGPRISAMAEASVQIQQMANAKKHASESIKSSPAPKGKSKAQKSPEPLCLHEKHRLRLIASPCLIFDRSLPGILPQAAVKRIRVAEFYLGPGAATSALPISLCVPAFMHMQT